MPTFRKTFFDGNTNLPLEGYDGHIYIVPAGNAVNSDMPLAEDSTNFGSYYRAGVDGGEYDLYIDLDKSGSPVAGDLKLQNIAFALGDGGVTIADGSITTAKLADDAVTNAKLAANAVDTAQILDAAVTAAKLAAGIGGNGFDHILVDQSISTLGQTEDVIDIGSLGLTNPPYVIPVSKNGYPIYLISTTAGEVEIGLLPFGVGDTAVFDLYIISND